MTEPTFDAQGYPTEETLEAIRKWPMEDGIGLLNFCKAAWYYPDEAFQGDYVWEFHTLGWSGNEEIIQAMQDNKFFWFAWWYSSKRGGHFEFKNTSVV